MYKVNRFSVYLALVILLFLQMTVVRHVKVMGSSPDLVLAAVVFFGLYLGSSAGLECGVLAGLLKDIFALDFFGINTFILALAGFLAGAVNTKVFRESKSTQALIVFLFSLALGSFHFTVEGFLSQNQVLNFTEYFSACALPMGIYTSLLSIPLFSKLADIFGLREREDIL